MSEQGLNYAEQKNSREPASVRVYFVGNTHCDGANLDEALRELGIYWPPDDDQAFAAHGSYQIEVPENQMEAVQEAMRENDYWIFLAVGPDGANLPEIEA